MLLLLLVREIGGTLSNGGVFGGHNSDVGALLHNKGVRSAHTLTYKLILY